ncbi:hypothetical protein H6504_01980 [Candidatus Woesearchaeota archaeon]|nr:hypothetical protein [Candidatus Woesearchaeota archaeon]
MKYAITLLLALVLCSAASFGAQIHAQPGPGDDPVNPPPAPISATNYDDRTKHLGLNIFYNPVLYTNNYLVNYQGQVCVGSELQVLNKEISGEWFDKGGPTDSPPITFVDNLMQAKRDFLSGNLYLEGYEGTLCSWLRLQESAECNQTGLPEHCENVAEGFCNFRGQVFCEDSCSNNNIPLSDFTAQGDAVYTKACDVKCALFRSDANVVWDLRTDVAQTASPAADYEAELAFKGVLSTEGPRLEVQETSYNEYLGVLRMKVQNTGDIGAKLDSAVLPGAEVMYMPKEVGAGQSDEIIMLIAGNGNKQVQLAYRAEELGCQNTVAHSNGFSVELAPGAILTPPPIVTNPDTYEVVLAKGQQPKENLLDLTELTR